MTKFGIRKTLGMAMAVCGLAAAMPASATTFMLGGGSSNGSVGNTRVFTSGSTTMRASGWSIDKNGKVHSAALGRWSMGVGVNNGSGDNSHTTDNSGWTDFILLQFNSAVILGNASFRTGWHGMNDTDASIGFANWAQPNTALPGWNNVAVATALSSFGFYESASSGNGNNTRNVNLLNKVGSTWIISASRVNADRSLDGYKLESLSFTTPPPAVPEPATWAMMLVGFGFVGGMMRRRSARTRLAGA